MKIKLTQNIVETYQCPDDKRKIELVDDFGMYLLITKNGSKTFYLRYRAADTNKTTHKKIGSAQVISLTEARKLAKQLKAKVVLGADPRAEEKAKRAVITYSEFFETHFQPYIEEHKKSAGKDIGMYNMRLKSLFGDKRLNHITRQEIITFHIALKNSGKKPATADHFLKLIRYSLNLAVDWGYLEKSPASRIKLFNVDNKVERYLSDEELRSLVAVLRNDDNKNVCRIILYLLSTGARLNEALQAKWIQIDIERHQWVIPSSNSKSKRTRIVPLNDAAIDVLKQCNRRSEWIFANPQTDKPFTTITRVWYRLRKEAGISDFRIHDLRHSFASFLANSGRTILEISQVLGHADTRVTQRYTHLTTQTLQEATQCASLKITEAMKVLPEQI